MKRPAGVTVIAVAYLILGGLSLLWSGMVFGIGGLTSLFAGLFGSELGNASIWSGFLGILAGALQIVVGFGLLSMQRWAWYLAIIVVGISVLQGVIGLFNGGLFVFLCGGLWLVIPIAILVYLLTSGVRETFGVT